MGGLFVLRAAPLALSHTKLFTLRTTTAAARATTITYASSKGSPRRSVSGPLPDSLVRRTRSTREFNAEEIEHFLSNGAHVPVLLGEVLDVFDRRDRPLRSFVDCTMGAAGHSSSIIRSHPELEIFIGLDIDPMAYKMANVQLDFILNNEGEERKEPALQRYTYLRNFRDIRSIVRQVDANISSDGVDGILMDLGMSSMQVNNAERGFSVLNDGPLDMRMNPLASLKAEDILNSWPEAEVGRILREYGEESNWHKIQTKIMKARTGGGLHSTNELLNLVRSACGGPAGRQGWMKTATRVFQALRIAVNDELNSLRDALFAAFDCLAHGGRLAVISFHSLEDRIVKQTFLDIIDREEGGSPVKNNDCEQEWCKQMIGGKFGTILTKRPITPSIEEEKLNKRCRGAKLRVLQKAPQQ
ncbi:Ribosomal RNA small subunit methyltransferase H [Nymphaea thermarum]|nr:Ribosomal RNA small subunit methyltransferase H [Nymphaea thermarum]